MSETVDTEAINAISISAVPEELWAKAYEAYLNSAESTAMIAQRMSIPEATLLERIRTGGWAARRKEMQQGLLDRLDTQYQEFAVTQRLPEAHRQLDSARYLQDLAMRTLKAEELLAEKRNEPMDLDVIYKAVKALTAAATQAAKIVGLSEQSASVRRDAPSSTTVLLMPGVTPSVPSTVKTIDV